MSKFIQINQIFLCITQSNFNILKKYQSSYNSRQQIYLKKFSMSPTYVSSH
jgi:hypothetical protein